MYTIKRTGHGFFIRTTLKRDLAEFLAITWGFLVPLGQEWDGLQFAWAIESHSASVGARFDANVLRHCITRKS